MAGYPIGRLLLPRPEITPDSKAEIVAEIDCVYRALGGVQESVPLKFGAWDMTVGSFVVELDEAQHFNRYRLQTLDSSLYQRLHAFPLREYRDYCQTHEPDCLKKAAYGNYWTTPGSERQFGRSSPDGSLEGEGPARWKQRAFYDYLRDMSPFLKGPHVVRISMYDQLPVLKACRTLACVIKGNMNVSEALAVAQTIESRARSFLCGEHLAPIWNGSLAPIHVPAPTAPWLDVARFALTFDGYQFWGSTHDCFAVAKLRSCETLSDFRTCLFFEQRRIRFDGREPTQSEWPYIRWLVDQIRFALEARSV